MVTMIMMVMIVAGVLLSMLLLDVVISITSTWRHWSSVSWITWSWRRGKYVYTNMGDEDKVVLCLIEESPPPVLGVTDKEIAALDD